jgi:hypothetical protein
MIFFPLMFSPFNEAFGFKARQTRVNPEDSKAAPSQHAVAADCERPVTSGCQFCEDWMRIENRFWSAGASAKHALRVK